MRLVLRHDDKVSVWYLVDRLMIGQVQAVHIGGYLPQKRLVPYGLGFAASLATLLAEVDSIEKSCTLSNLMADASATHIS